MFGPEPGGVCNLDSESGKEKSSSSSCEVHKVCAEVATKKSMERSSRMSLTIEVHLFPLFSLAGGPPLPAQFTAERWG